MSALPRRLSARDRLGVDGMALEGLAGYASSLAAITAAPGPLVAILVARSLARDLSGASAFAVGLAFGDLIVVAALCAGLASWADAAPGLLGVLRFAGAGYLLWLAARTWSTATDPARAVAPGQRLAPMALAGTLTCIGNPQTMLLYLALLPGVLAQETLSFGRFLAVGIVTVATTLCVFGLVIGLAARAGRLLSTPRAARRCNRAVAVAMVAAAAWIVTS